MKKELCCIFAFALIFPPTNRIDNPPVRPLTLKLTTYSIF